MKRRDLVCLWLAAASLEAAATTVVIPSGSRQLTLRVGSTGGTIDTVSFDIPALTAGTGTPITGSPAIYVEVFARRPGGPARTYSLTVDSSVSLTNGTDTIPFTDFSWTTSDNDIPPGTLNGTASQQLLTFQNNRQIYNTHTFIYANTLLLPPGTYTGQLAYTLAEL